MGQFSSIEMEKEAEPQRTHLYGSDWWFLENGSATTTLCTRSFGPSCKLGKSINGGIYSNHRCFEGLTGSSGEDRFQTSNGGYHQNPSTTTTIHRGWPCEVHHVERRILELGLLHGSALWSFVPGGWEAGHLSRLQGHEWGKHDSWATALHANTCHQNGRLDSRTCPCWLWCKMVCQT